MAKFQSERYLHNTQIQSSMISGVTNSPTITHNFLAATTVAVGDFILMCKLPERSAILGIEVVCSALGTGITADVGTMDANETDIDAKFIADGNLAAQKWIKISDNVIEGRLAKVHDRPTTIAIKLKGAGTIPKGAFIHITPHYRHANNDE